MLFKNNTYFSILFFIIVFAELICSSIKSLTTIHYITKPLILLLLIVLFITQSKHLSLKTRKFAILALLFSLIGDILLMFVNKSDLFFIGGLVAFLLAHTMYIIVFLNKRNSKSLSIPFVVVLMIYAFVLFYVLRNSLGELLIPVIVYMLIILTMVISASLRKDRVSKFSYNLVFIGALFFMISDSILSLNKFYQPIPLSNIGIMLTYAIAQLFIVLGIKNQQ